MKKITRTALAVMMLCALQLAGQAQCTSCTTTITTNDPTNHLITTGTTLCIAAGGTCTGLIEVAGGTLCNQGMINNHNLEVDGGGILNNYGTITADSLLVIGSGSVLNNYSNLTDTRLAVTNHGAINNAGGTITCAVFGDSLATLVNNGNFTTTGIFSSGYSASVTNGSYMRVGANFYNGYSASFYTACMVIVKGAWYNSATITGPTGSGCGGFSITSGSYNSGTVGAAGQHVDICDASHPAGGITGNSGTMTGVTFCTCTNSCPASGIVSYAAPATGMFKNLYPNPSTTAINLGLRLVDAGNVEVRVYDVLGKQRFSKQYTFVTGDNLLTVDVSSLEAGLFLVSVTDSKGSREMKSFEVVR